MECEEFRGIISEYVDGDLDEPIRSAAAEHEKECTLCRRELEAFRRVMAAAAELPDPVPPDGVRFEILSSIQSPRARRDFPEIMDIEELKSYLGVTAEELELEIENLPAFEFAGRLRFKKQHIDRWIEERERDRARGIETARVAGWLKRRNAG